MGRGILRGILFAGGYGEMGAGCRVPGSVGGRRTAEAGEGMVEG